MMSTFAFADTVKYTITVKKAEANHTYTAYQIFSGDLKVSDKTLSNIAWGSGIDNTKITGFTYLEKDTAKDIAEELGKQTGNEEAIARAFAKAIADKVDTAKGTVLTYDNEKYTASVTPGYYLIIETENSSNNNKNHVLADYMLKVVGDISLDPKDDNKIPTPGKTADKTNAAVGEEVTYQLTFKTPDNYADYDTYKLIIADTMTNLEYVENSINAYYIKEGETLPNTISDLVSDNKNVSANSITVNISDLKTVVSGISANDTLYIEYKAKVTADAINGDAKNNAHYEYSNNPKADGLGEYDVPEVVVHNFNLKFVKKDGTTNAMLPGAGFALYKADDNWSKSGNAIMSIKQDRTKVDSTTGGGIGIVSFETNETTFNFKGLAAGKYLLEEIETPEGYNTLSEPIKITIEDNNNGTCTITIGDKNVAENTAAIVNNFKGSQLPETGGIGTTIFYLIGAILVIGAGVVFVTRRRMHSDKQKL